MWFYAFILKWLGLNAVDDGGARRVVNPGPAVTVGPLNSFLEVSVSKTTRIRCSLGLTEQGARIFK